MKAQEENLRREKQKAIAHEKERVLELANKEMASWVYIVHFENVKEYKSIGYILSDSSIGILVKDRTKLISGPGLNSTQMYH